ncbi:MAG: hypothetical protein L0Z62_26840 [Gemmataceae bacterium]|nr:hypothetical protein [Gemmataceae bacterium]
MSPPLRDHKNLSEWMELDYFQRPRRIRRVRRTLAVLGLILGLVFLAVLLWPAAHVVHQAGPLASAHTMFSNDCQQCHIESFRPAQRLLQFDPTVRAVSDDACKKCHDGPVHHETQSHTPACASCHREHRGKVLLAQVPDAYCVSCHIDLPANMKKGKVQEDRFHSPITSFAGDHPQFALWDPKRPENRRDPTRLRFNHHVHLKLKPEQEPQLKGKPLECSQCHQPDAERRYMKPVTYERHCKDCHPLAVQVVGDFPKENKDLFAAVQKFNREWAPHKEPASVREELRQRYRRFLREHPEVTKVPFTFPLVRPLPGRSQDPPKPSEDWAGQQLELAERMLFDGGGGCRYCHERKAPREPGELPQFLPNSMPARWFAHSVFRHDSHRMLNCTECHGAAEKSELTSDVLLPRIDNCKQCHNPQVGARQDCVACHLYHDYRKERPFAGKLTIKDCLGR